VVLACLYDVHGNLAALEAVVADAQAAGADRWILGGDYVLMGPRPAEAFEALRALPGPALWIRGNTDRWLREPPDDEDIRGAIEYCCEQLDDLAVSVLSSLPPEGRYGDDTRIVHASPGSDMVGFSPEASEDDAGLLAHVSEQRLLFGHTHIQFQRRVGEHELINPGSVGVPFDGDPRPGYALIGDDDTVELRRVEYDHEAAAKDVERLGGAWAEAAARRIRTASF
jgi:predicted phosphodiesterase